MRNYKCAICGFIYEEAVGFAEKDIASGTKWEEIPQDFTCPWCGAEKKVFEELKVHNTVANSTTEKEVDFENLGELSAGELSVLCSNLAKGCEKQQLTEEMDLLYQLADYYKDKVVLEKEKEFDEISKLLNDDLSDRYAKANAIAVAEADRGALRAIVWSEKVSKMINSLLSRYDKDGESIFDNKKIYVCDICGFIYLGNDLPEVCPVCKVPNFKINEIERR